MEGEGAGSCGGAEASGAGSTSETGTVIVEVLGGTDNEDANGEKEVVARGTPGIDYATISIDENAQNEN